jgi:hypothetical protein
MVSPMEWTQFTTSAEFGDAQDFWGAAPDDAWLVGQGGAIHHFDGAQFSAVSSPTTQTLYRIFGRTRDDIYAVGASGTILHYDGSDWVAEQSGTTLDFTDIVFTRTHVQVFAHGTAILSKELP